MPGQDIDHKPELISHILAETSLTADQCIMVGDRKFDVAGAHANRMRAIGVLWGYGSREELEIAGADRLIETPAELIGSYSIMTLHYPYDTAMVAERCGDGDS